MHIVSNVTGELKNNLTPMDVLYAGLPAGTVSGAPKIRALELLEEQEDINREFYSGSVCYLDINGDIESYDFQEATINSHKRFTYNEVEYLKNNVSDIESNILDSMSALEELTLKRLKNRVERSALEIDSAEPTLKFDNQDKYKVKFIGIVHNSLVDKKEDSIRLIDKFNIKYQNIYDENGDLVNDFNVLGFPTTLFFDRNHKLSKKWTGYLDEENLIEQLEKINN